MYENHPFTSAIVILVMQTQHFGLDGGRMYCLVPREQKEL